MSRLTKRNADGTAWYNHTAEREVKNGDILEKLAHYEDLEGAGRLITLQCNVGTEVFFVTSNEKIYSTTLGTIESVLRHGDAIGDGLYLTKAEAEAKMEEMERANE